MGRWGWIEWLWLLLLLLILDVFTGKLLEQVQEVGVLLRNDGIMKGVDGCMVVSLMLLIAML